MITKRSYTAQEETTASPNTRIPTKIYQKIKNGENRRSLLAKGTPVAILDCSTVGVDMLLITLEDCPYICRTIGLGPICKRLDGRYDTSVM
jgi:hypothetical protein